MLRLLYAYMVTDACIVISNVLMVLE
uniref:Uncharacterized protein n=1 Tax=Arundo donax TaxID=35708 RepID=A0A0A9HD55_ARUDO